MLAYNVRQHDILEKDQLNKKELKANTDKIILLLKETRKLICMIFLPNGTTSLT